MKLNLTQILLAILILAVSFGIYWLGIKPSQTKKQCNEWAMENTTKKFPSFTDSRNYNQEDYDGLYSKCLRERGI